MFLMSEKAVKLNQRVESTRHAILDAAVELYQNQGVEKTTVSAIIMASGVGRTTFYRHFVDQDEVLNQALLREFEVMMGEFEAQRFEHESLEAQIIEDMVWFFRQLSSRPALSLLFDRKNQFVSRINATLQGFRLAGMTCTKPTFDRAQREGCLRVGVTLENYVDWVTFVITSLEIVEAPFTRDEFQLRDTLRRFLIPSLIKI
ncbi:uncharacterized protein METZ01_LOCUS181057 [marine metagenome]|uniref:HTH tetR-type domain-containing protein n=1 Tax=marine metagenome TaxID=408172 RepID=A0A382CSB9_9ZZZZ